MTYSPYARSREPVYAQNGMVAASQPLASQAGLAILRAGGNAVDAAIATAAALTVVEPTQNGIGGDAFALVWHQNQLHGLNGSGRMPAAATRDALGLNPDQTKLGPRGWQPVTVPGTPRAWADLHARFGQLPYAQLFEPAIHYAESGHPLSPVVAEFWRAAKTTFADCTGPAHQAWWETFLPAGFEPVAGQRWRSPGHADTLRQIAASKSDAFYTGRIAEAIDQFAQETGGWLRGDDLAAHHSDWVEPISIGFKNHEVWQIPPNTQAIAALQALGLLDQIDLPAHREDALGLHYQIEALKLGFADALAYVADPQAMPVSPKAMLGPDYLAARRKLITDQAGNPAPGAPAGGETVYLATADASGMMVSFIQSNYQGFGSGLLVPGTGVALHNRGCGFSLDPEHPNCVAPGKRPYHTIMPGFLTHQGNAVGPFGVMGAYMQPQGHVQVMLNHLVYGLHPQAILDAPRWQWMQGRHIRVEQAMPRHVVRGLVDRGHIVEIGADDGGFGRGQIIWRNAEGVLCGGSDTRGDGHVSAF